MKLFVCALAVAPLLTTAARATETWTLPAAVHFAMAHNPDARLAMHRIAAARAEVDQANAAFLPRLQFRSSYLRTSNPMLVFGAILNQQAFRPTLDFNDVPDVDNANVKGVVTFPIYTGGFNRARRHAATANEAAARSDARTVRHTVAFETARTFYTILKTGEFVRATEAAVHAFDKNLEVARNRLAAGTLLRNDELDVEVRLARAQEDLIRARNARALALRALRNLLGLDEKDIAIVDSAAPPPLPHGKDAEGRPELIAAGQRLHAAEAAAAMARSGYLPRVNAFAGMDYDHGWRLNNGAWSYTAGLSAEWDLWDGNRTRARVAQAMAELEAAREQVRKTRLAIRLQVEQAQIALKEARERLTVTEKSVTLAAKSADLTRSLFEEGLAISTQLIDAEAALTAARVRRAEAEADRNIAIAALRKALGQPLLPPGPETE